MIYQWWLWRTNVKIVLQLLIKFTVFFLSNGKKIKRSQGYLAQIKIGTTWSHKREWNLLLHPYLPYLNFFFRWISFKNTSKGSSWSWSYGSWIYNYLCNRCLSPLILWVWIPLSDFQPVCGFLRVLRFPQPIKLTTTIYKM
jgi:hypothetical protein